tara:strand:- start:551 stop:793 length:243 start_codon:yes stop_codon:yes gene_type:complete
MIVGSILEIGYNTAGSQHSGTNGASSVVFYTEADAENWCRLQSMSVVYGTGNLTSICLCVYVNTDNDLRRWWYAGVEYTG